MIFGAEGRGAREGSEGVGGGIIEVFREHVGSLCEFLVSCKHAV